jgi:exodeoxyribonuclease V alpha subunit
MNTNKLLYIDHAFAKRAGGEKEEHLALLATLFASSRQGHLALDLSTHPHLLADADTLASPFVCKYGNLLYLKKNWIYETEILKHLDRLHHYPPLIELKPSADMKLNFAQRQAVEMAMKNSLMLLSGGPGTGKTFTAAAFVKACVGLRVVLTAPTGKAVAQLEGNLRASLSESASIRAGTLHALLGIKEYDREEEEINELLADLIIVDECSMIDARIFSRLLASVPSGARLLLIGDKNQLPPIEAGSVFADLIDAAVYPYVHLTECLRSDRSEILTVAEQIKQGNGAAVQKSDSWVDLAEKKITPADLWEECRDRFTNYELEKPDPEQVLSMIGRFSLLSSMRQGPLGVEAINRHFLYQSLKTVPEGAWWIAPIMITRNDYDLELYNGDLGVLVRKCSKDFSLRELSLEDYAWFPRRKESISALALSSFEYSYCLSIHKSQGSEYDETVILIPPGSECFGREAIYTAVTRTRQKMTLMCSAEMLLQSISTSSKKMSGIVQRLHKTF